MDKKSIVSIIDQYFQRFPFRKIEINDPISLDLKIIVVIPVYNEDAIEDTLESIFLSQKDFSFSIEIILLINNSTDAPSSIIKKNQNTYNNLKLFALQNNHFHIHLLPVYLDDLDPKHAGVGWARKLGMDLALQRFKKVGYNGIIVGLDADTKVANNYFNEINQFFIKTDFQAGSIHFEHPTKGVKYHQFNYDQIIYYELHLRYYKNALLYIGLPYAFYTIGSAFALTAKAYARQGGMNRRKAGEDFYFINKLIKGEKFGEINKTMVFPSPRISDRVPFGTGRAILEASKSKKDLKLTYDFKSFQVLKEWIEIIKSKSYNYIQFPKLIKQFMTFKEWEAQHQLFLKNSSNKNSYQNMFYKKFDAFWILKFIHFSRDKSYKNSSLVKNTNFLLDKLGYKNYSSAIEQLNLLRTIDQKGLNKPLEIFK